MRSSVCPVVDLRSPQRAPPNAQPGISTQPGAAASTPAARQNAPVAAMVMCPYGCSQWVPMLEMDSHELMHQLEGDQQAAAAALACAGDDADAAARAAQQAANFEALQAQYGFSNKRNGRCFTCGEEGHWSPDCPRNPRAPPPQPPLSTSLSELTRAQRRDGYPGLPKAALLAGCGGLVPTLARLLSQRPPPGHEAYLCGAVHHISAQYADRGWGCGWRNIQMLSSHVLQQVRGRCTEGAEQNSVSHPLGASRDVAQFQQVAAPPAVAVAAVAAVAAITAAVEAVAAAAVAAAAVAVAAAVAAVAVAAAVVAVAVGATPLPLPLRRRSLAVLASYQTLVGALS
ncbi:hypothetical protein FOA52_001478 [Chlamydomonas sp. UWO 241]|nr:hypothetical protein FOA52_001478 [Chlamydomonas sp. UWO 241]